MDGKNHSVDIFQFMLSIMSQATSPKSKDLNTKFNIAWIKNNCDCDC